MGSIVGLFLEIVDINKLYGKGSYMGASTSRNHKVLEDIVNFCKDHDGLQDITKHTFQDRLSVISSMMNILNFEISSISKDAEDLLQYERIDQAALDFKQISQLVNTINTKSKQLKPSLGKLKESMESSKMILVKKLV